MSKAQKTQNIFFGKKLKIFEKNSFGKCRTVPKNVKGGPFLIYKHAFCSKITKNSKGGPFGDIKKNFEKKLHGVEKCERGTLLDLLTYILLQDIKKTRRGTLWGHQNFRKKSAQCRKKSKGGPFGLVRFCRLP